MIAILEALPKAKTWALVLAIVLILMTIGTIFTVIIPIFFILLTVFLFQFRGACKRLEVSQHSNDLLDICKAQKRFLMTQGVLGIVMALLLVVGLFISVRSYKNYSYHAKHYNATHALHNQ